MSSILFNTPNQVFESRGRVPTGHIELSYIATTGNSYINTGLVLKNIDNIEWISDFMLTSNATDDKCVAGARNSEIGYKFPNTYRTYYEAEPASQTIYTYGRKKVNSRVRMVFKYWKDNSSIINKVEITENGSTVFSQSDFPPTVAATSAPVYVAAHNESNVANWYFIGNIYEIICVVNDVVTLHLIPDMNENGIVGMYDMISGVFFSSETNTPFVAGDPV